MFHAFVIVCAVSLSGEVDTGNCKKLDDNWGPHRNMETCTIRAEQMKDEVLVGRLNVPMFTILGYPPFIVANEFCELTDEIEV